MRKALTAFASLLAFVSIAAAQTPGGWVKVSSAEGRFSVLMPSKAEEKTDRQDSAHGPYSSHLFMVRDADEIYLVGWVDYDPSFKFDVQGELEANRDNLCKGLNATVLDTTKIVLNGYPGIEFTAEIPDTAENLRNYNVKSRVYIVGARPYQLVVLSPKGTDATQDTSRFFSSFEVSAK